LNGGKLGKINIYYAGKRKNGPRSILHQPPHGESKDSGGTGMFRRGKRAKEKDAGGGGAVFLGGKKGMSQNPGGAGEVHRGK